MNDKELKKSWEDSLWEKERNKALKELGIEKEIEKPKKSRDLGKLKRLGIVLAWPVGITLFFLLHYITWFQIPMWENIHPAGMHALSFMFDGVSILTLGFVGYGLYSIYEYIKGY